MRFAVPCALGTPDVVFFARGLLLSKTKQFVPAIQVQRSWEWHPIIGSSFCRECLKHLRAMFLRTRIYQIRGNSWSKPEICLKPDIVIEMTCKNMTFANTQQTHTHTHTHVYFQQACPLFETTWFSTKGNTIPETKFCRKRTQLHLPTSAFQVICLFQRIMSRCAFHQLSQMAQAESACLSRCGLQILAQERCIVLLAKKCIQANDTINITQIIWVCLKTSDTKNKERFFLLNALGVPHFQTHPTKTVTLSISTGLANVASRVSRIIKASRKKYP